MCEKWYDAIGEDDSDERIEKYIKRQKEAYKKAWVSYDTDEDIGLSLRDVESIIMRKTWE